MTAVFGNLQTKNPPALADDTFPQGGRHFFPKTPTILTKRLQPAPPAHTVAIQLVQGDFVCCQGGEM